MSQVSCISEREWLEKIKDGDEIALEEDPKMFDVEECEEVEADDDSDSPPLEEAIQMVRQAFDLYINNQFAEGLAMADRYSRTSLYHSAAKSYMMALGAGLNMDQDEIDEALKSANQTLVLCKRYKKSSIVDNVMRFFWTIDFNSYTDVELHAEIIYTNMLLIKSLLTFIRDRSFMSMIRFGFTIKHINSCFKECLEIIKTRNYWTSDLSMINFKANTFLANGSLNLIASHLPAALLKLIRLVGFGGDRKKGLRLLHQVSNEDSLYSNIVKIILMCYHTYGETLFGLNCDDPKQIEQLIDRGLKESPDSAWYLLFKARNQYLQGNLESAIKFYQGSIDSQSEFPQLHYLCHWEMSFCHALKSEWDEAISHNRQLVNCPWTEAMFAYERASFLYMKMLTEGASEEIKKEIASIYRSVPNLTKRYAGQRLTPEKVIAERSVRYFQENETIVMPLLESIYMYNVFTVFKNRPELSMKYIDMIKRLLTEKIYKSPDDIAYLKFYNGIFHKLIKRFERAEDYFKDVLEMYVSLVHPDLIDNLRDSQLNDKYGIGPQACLELGIMYFEIGNLTEAKEWLNKTLKDYNDYWSQMVVHLRAHSLRQKIEDMERQLEKDDVENADGNESFDIHL